MTIDELERLKAEMLRDDPAYRAEVEAAEEKRRLRSEELRAAERPIVEDLRHSGVQVESVWDLVNTSDPYHAALPVLMSHLEKGDYPDRVMESLGRALAVKPSIEFWDRLKARYVDARCPGEEDGTAVALAACATKANVDDLIHFLAIEDRGESRIYFLRPIRRLGGDRGFELIESLQDHPVLGREASAIAKRKRR